MTVDIIRTDAISRARLPEISSEGDIRLASLTVERPLLITGKTGIDGVTNFDVLCARLGNEVRLPYHRLDETGILIATTPTDKPGINGIRRIQLSSSSPIERLRVTTYSEQIASGLIEQDSDTLFPLDNSLDLSAGDQIIFGWIPKLVNYKPVGPKPLPRIEGPLVSRMQALEKVDEARRATMLGRLTTLRSFV